MSAAGIKNLLVNGAVVDRGELEALYVRIAELEAERDALKAQLRATYFNAPYLAAKEVVFDKWAFERWLTFLADECDNGTALEEAGHQASEGLRWAAREETEDNEYPACEDCRNTGHPWVDGAEPGMSGPDFRYFCGCPQGRDMQDAAAREETP